MKKPSLKVTLEWGKVKRVYEVSSLDDYFSIYAARPSVAEEFHYKGHQMNLKPYPKKDIKAAPAPHEWPHE